ARDRRDVEHAAGLHANRRRAFFGRFPDTTDEHGAIVIVRKTGAGSEPPIQLFLLPRRSPRLADARAPAAFFAAPRRGPHSPSRWEAYRQSAGIRARRWAAGADETRECATSRSSSRHRAIRRRMSSPLDRP